MLPNLDSSRIKTLPFIVRPGALNPALKHAHGEVALHGPDSVAFSKSRDLFDGRLISGVARRHLAGDSFRRWFSDAISIQMAIYGLDFHFEQSDSIRAADVAPLWRAVADRLRRADGKAAETLWSSFADLQQYAMTETRIHEFDPIDPREFETIVRLKCADVRIARSLVWIRAGLPVTSALLRYWRLFDQCWEFIEDLQDIAEDGRDWNFNFWLYAFMAGGDPVHGIDGAAAALRRDVQDLEVAYSRLPVPDRVAVQDSFTRTASAARWALSNCSLALFATRRGQVIRFQDKSGRADCSLRDICQRMDAAENQVAAPLPGAAAA